MNENVLPEYLNLLLKKVWEETKPISIFLYGSRAKGDFNNDSDYEIGIIYERDKKWSRQKLSEINEFKNVKIYPFITEDLKNGEIDTPFPKMIYLQELRQTGVVLYGKKLEKIIKCSDINKNDLSESIGFCLGRAYGAVVSSRQGDWVAVRDGFTKSAIYGLQVLVFLKTRELIFPYREIVKKSLNLIDKKYIDLINHVGEVRENNVLINTSLLYKNISFLNEILSEIKKF